MSTVWAIATHTNNTSDGRSSWVEPEIGRGVYGKMKNMHPIFRDQSKAVKYAELLDMDVSVVEMEFRE